jgi:alpha-tubulin suppressor-like RCC1 family protein
VFGVKLFVCVVGVRVVDVECGGDHTLLRTNDGQLFAAGWNEQYAYMLLLTLSSISK